MTSKMIENLIKQNDAIYSSLVSRNIEFERPTIDHTLANTENEHVLLEALKDENTQLKNLAKANRPPPPPPKPYVPPKITVDEKSPELKQGQGQGQDQGHNQEDEAEEVYEDPKPTFKTNINMEELKRSFFNTEYELFEQIVKQHSTELKFYTATYKYSSDKDGAPEYSASNLLKGFVRMFDDYRKYFMICFRCLKTSTDPNQYTYTSYWIVNTDTPVEQVVKNIGDDFEFCVVPDTELDQFVRSMQKIDFEKCTECVGENYVH